MTPEIKKIERLRIRKDNALARYDAAKTPLQKHRAKQAFAIALDRYHGAWLDWSAKNP